MIDRRALLALLAAAATPAGAAEPLADQPALPGPLARYRDLPVRAVSTARPETRDGCWARRGAAVCELLGHLVRACAWRARRLAQIRMLYPEERLAMVGLNIDATADGRPPATSSAARRR
jgi:hypothetical protein